MSTVELELRREIESLRAEVEKLRKDLSIVTNDRDNYRRELFLAFPPPDYTDAEIANFINNRVPADQVMKELEEIIRNHTK